MNNTDKLLRAFIEASGFEIEEVSNTYISGIKYGGDAPLIPFTPMDKVTTSIDYKVTKKDEGALSYGTNGDEYTILFCNRGGHHTNGSNACGGDYGVCSKCDQSIRSPNNDNNEWFSKL